MAKKSKKKKGPGTTRRNPAAELTDDLIVDILARLPAKSVCRCRCVSTRWRGLISDPHHRKKLPQTLAGFFYRSEKEGRFPMEARHFVNVTGRGRPLIYPSFSFMPRFERIKIVDSCGGLLLLRCFVSSGAFLYVVCNPSTGKWVALPESGYDHDEDGVGFCTRLGFDPAVSHFHVFEFVIDDCGYVVGVEIYSSESGEWNYSECEWWTEWDSEINVYDDQTSVFFSGMLHLVILPLKVVAVDVKGEIWRTMWVPETKDVEDVCCWMPGFIGQSQGKLYYISAYNTVPLNLSIWVLEDYTKDEWTLKHNVTTEQLSEKINYKYKTDVDKSCYYLVVTLHPECNLIYYIADRGNTLMSYDMDRKESCVIQDLGSDCKMGYLPYVPFYSETLSNGC